MSNSAVSPSIARTRGRIRAEDLKAVLVEDLGDDADFLIGSLGTRYQLRLAMLQFPLRLDNT